MSNKKTFNTSSPAFIPKMDSNFASRTNHPPQPSKPVDKPKGKKNRESKSNPQSNFNYHDSDFSSQLEEQLINGSYQPKGKKGKISIDHLLEFSFASPESSSQHRTPSRKIRHHDTGLHLTGMSFINVNYKFVVDYRGDYRSQVLDPNLPVDLSNVLRIIIPKGNSCPICLSDEPIAPRMLTSCGHILCLTCLLSFIESEPVLKKGKPVKKHKECPLCASVIRKDEIIPAFVDAIDERFERPKIGEEVVLNLMTRPFDSILPLPIHLINYHTRFQNYPWYLNTEVQPYSRILKGDLNYIIEFLEKEKEDIISNNEMDKLLYNDNGIFAEKAIQDINHNIDLMSIRFDNKRDTPSNVVKNVQRYVLAPDEDFTSKYNVHNTFFYYQTGFNSNVTFVLSLLDVNLLRHAFGTYSNFPSSLILKIENIKYDEVSPELIKKFKYLSHLPYGTEVGILECDWSDNSMIPTAVFQEFKQELKKRTQKMKTKTRKEEQDRIDALNNEELREKEFYERENQGWGSYDFEQNFGKMNIDGVYDLPPLSSATSTENKSSLNFGETGKSKVLQKTVWGTSIPKPESEIPTEDERNDANEFIRMAKENTETQDNRKKGKKKVVILSSSSRRV